MNDMRKIGIGLTGFGVGFTALGVLMMFDAALIAMGNVLFLSGLTVIIGPQRSVRFFFQRKKLRGSVLFFSGIAIVLLRSPIVGILVESFGFVNLFGDFFPIALAFLRRLPIIGNVLSLPYVSAVVERLVASSKLPV